MSYIAYQLWNEASWEGHVSKGTAYFNDCGLSLNDLIDSFDNLETGKGQLIVCSSIMQYVGCLALIHLCVPCKQTIIEPEYFANWCSACYDASRILLFVYSMSDRNQNGEFKNKSEFNINHLQQ